jgi:hypothetical protein
VQLPPWAAVSRSFRVDPHVADLATGRQISFSISMTTANERLADHFINAAPIAAVSPMMRVNHQSSETDFYVARRTLSC